MTTAVQPDTATASTILKNCLDRLGLTLDAAARDAVVTQFAASVRLDASGRPFALDQGGSPRVTVRNGQAVDEGVEGVVALTHELVQRHSTPAAVAPASSTESLISRMIQRRAQEAGNLRQQAEAIAAASNPWVPGGNLTHRMLIARHAPGTAERLRREAGAK